MSQDLKIEKICDHRISKEQVSIQDDYKTILIPRTLSSRRVELWIDGYLISSEHPKFGWTIEEDNTFLYVKRYKIIFNNIRKSHTDFYFISYSVQPNYCPKCFGQKIINDESFSKLGKAIMVQNEEKLMQEIKKGISTELGSNPFHDWIGTQIYQMIGTKVYNVEIIKSKIIYEISKYLEQYLDVQIQQYNYQSVTNREAFLKVLSIEVDPQYDIDISYWVITIIFRNRAGEDYVYEKQIQVPSASPYP